MKKIKKWHILLASFLIGVAVIVYTSTLEAYKVDTFTPEHKEKLKDYSSIKAYIVEQAEKNGLDPIDIMSIIACESHFNENAIGVNANKTSDLGLVQVNSLHVKSGSISIKCAGDARCAVDWMIAKRLRDESYNAWSCASRLGIN